MFLSQHPAFKVSSGSKRSRRRSSRRSTSSHGGGDGDNALVELAAVGKAGLANGQGGEADTAGDAARSGDARSPRSGHDQQPVAGTPPAHASSAKRRRKPRSRGRGRKASSNATDAAGSRAGSTGDEGASNAGTHSTPASHAEEQPAQGPPPPGQEPAAAAQAWHAAGQGPPMAWMQHSSMHAVALQQVAMEQQRALLHQQQALRQESLRQWEAQQAYGPSPASYVLDPASGYYVDVATGYFVDPETGYLYSGEPA